MGCSLIFTSLRLVNGMRIVFAIFALVLQYCLAQSSVPIDPYCGCSLDKKFGMPDGWDSTEIWIDVVIILDTSEAMKLPLSDACVLIESLPDVLTTDSKAQFYTRVGLIAISDTAQTLYNLNMTESDSVCNKVQIKEGLAQIDILEGFSAASNMLKSGHISRPDRANTRQVIYYFTDSDTNFDLSPVEQFKSSGGIIMVNNFVVNGEPAHPGLEQLASPGYYYTDIQYNYMETIQLFCKANCFCGADKISYAGYNTDPEVYAGGGCLHAALASLQYPKAIASCASLGTGGLIVSLHDGKKADFVANLMKSAAPFSDYYWIGYSKVDDGTWRWEDESTDPYTNWDRGEPSPAGAAKCAYVDKTISTLPWGAGNCNMGFPYVCEFAPCMVGNKNC